MTLQSEILDGLDIPGWDQSIDAVKRAVGNALHQLDRTAHITDTNYFNHSFVPDFILRWPREAGRTREVFLRLDTSVDFLAVDLQYLHDERPVFLGLTALDSQGPFRSETGRDAGLPTASAMLTEPAAVERLAAAVPNAEFGQVVPAAVLKGGRGWITEDRADGIATAASSFFSGARTHEPQQIEAAVPFLAATLDERQTDQLLNFGRIIWEATGGEAALFPVATPLAGVDDAGLRFLLEEAPSEDALFWRSIGRLVSLERLLGLGVRTGSRLTALIRANADRLYARGLLVKAIQPRLDSIGPFWELAGGGVALNGSDFVAYMAPRRDDLTVSPDSASALSFKSFRNRTSDDQVATVTVIAADGKKVTIESDDIFDPGTDAVLASVGDLPGATIASVGLIVGGKHLDCDFTNRLAFGHTSAVFDILSLVERALPMLWPLTDPGDVAELRTVRATVASVSRHPTLFDSLETDE